jgi:hypothetical protein
VGSPSKYQGVLVQLFFFSCDWSCGWRPEAFFSVYEGEEKKDEKGA